MNILRITTLIASLATLTGCGAFPSFDVRICTPHCDTAPAARLPARPAPAPPPNYPQAGWPPPPPHVPPAPPYPQVRHPPAPPHGCPSVQLAGTPQYCNPTVAPRPPGSGPI